MTSARDAGVGGRSARAQPAQPEVTATGVAAADDRRFVVDLDDAAACEPALAGGKAAALARARAGGLRTLPGVVLTTAFSDAVERGADVAGHHAVRRAYERAAAGGRQLVARSSSVVEDAAESSMAGQFASVVGVEGLDAFAGAVRTVLDSRRRAGASDAPIAVLVQPLLAPVCGGVLFGVDPVSGRSDRLVVSAVEGAPGPLVAGEVAGSRYLLDPHGAVVEFTRGDGPALTRQQLRALARLAADVASAFGGPQDVEWAIDREGTLWLLQARPVTTEVRGAPVGPVYGPGPVAETFPEPLTELECDLWVPPLRQAVVEAVELAGVASRREVRGSQVVVAVDGHVAIDLHLAGEVPAPGHGRQWSPRRALRRLRGSWRVGRLRAALPRLAEHLLDRVDHDLEAVPALPELSSRQLLGLLHRSRTVLRALHAHEILMGLLIDARGNRLTGASVALRVLAQAREDGLSDDEILGRSPVVLALVPPRVAPRPELPQTTFAVALGADAEGSDDAGLLREALRLRIRWMQELSGRAAWALGVRLAAAGQLPEPGLVRHMSLDHLEAVATKRAEIVPALVAAHRHRFGDPLPTSFQLSDRGRPIRVGWAEEVGGGTGAGGGVAAGPVTYDTHEPPAGSVLVTSTLAPGLGPLLPRLSGIVAETGSVLSHLAILARESGVPTVVGYHDARRDLPEGAVVEVDGATGRVTVRGGVDRDRNRNRNRDEGSAA